MDGASRISNTINVGIHGVPRSGTSWLAQIVNSSPAVVFKYQPLFSYRFKGYLNPRSSRADIVTFFREIAAAEDDFLDQRERIRSGIYPRFQKWDRPTHVVYKEVRYHHLLTHLLATDDELKIVGIIRNPLAVINSWLRAPREFRRDLGWRPRAEWRHAASKNRGRVEEFYGYEKWKEVARLFADLADAFPQRFHTVAYADLLQRPLDQVQALFAFCALPLERQTLDFLRHSRAAHHDHPYSVYKRRETDHAWRQQLDPEIASQIISDLADAGLEHHLKE